MEELEGSDSFIVSVEGNGEDVYLHSHCFLCLRETNGGISSSSPSGRRKRARLEEEEPVPLGLPSWSPTLLQTLQWMWWTVRHEIRDLRDIPNSRGISRESCKISKFATVLKICEDCGVMVESLDTLQNQLTEQLEKLNRLVAEGRSKRVTKLQQTLCSSGLEEREIEKSLAFLVDNRCDSCLPHKNEDLGNQLQEDDDEEACFDFGENADNRLFKSEDPLSSSTFPPSPRDDGMKPEIDKETRQEGKATITVPSASTPPTFGPVHAGWTSGFLLPTFTTSKEPKSQITGNVPSSSTIL